MYLRRVCLRECIRESHISVCGTYITDLTHTPTKVHNVLSIHYMLIPILNWTIYWPNTNIFYLCSPYIIYFMIGPRGGGNFQNFDFLMGISIFIPPNLKILEKIFWDIDPKNVPFFSFSCRFSAKFTKNFLKNFHTPNWLWLPTPLNFTTRGLFRWINIDIILMSSSWWSHRMHQ